MAYKYINSETPMSDINNLDENQIYIWTLGKGGEIDKNNPYTFVNCTDCIAKSGQIRSLKGWKKIALPGKHGTSCCAKCTCRLNLINNDIIGDTF